MPTNLREASLGISDTRVSEFDHYSFAYKHLQDIVLLYEIKREAMSFARARALVCRLLFDLSH